VNGLTVTGAWAITPAVLLPATVQPGGQLDVRLQFRAEGGDLNTGSLKIDSSDPDRPSLVVQLAGFWQSVSEGGQEPELSELASLFGYATKIVGAGQSLNRAGLVQAVGDEVLSPYWDVADTSRPVSVRQLAAYHTQGNGATISWFAKGSGSGTSTSVFGMAGIDGQSILPHRGGSATQYAEGSFTPGGAFGLKVDSETSDPTKNNTAPDKNNGCTGLCGHHMRFWPVKDRQGAIVPNTYIMSMDYSGINYDYNDNVYLISNMKPAGILYRLNTAGPAYTDNSGQPWTSDAGLFSPASGIAEDGGSPPPAIALTENDTLYQTYRGNTGSITPRTMTFELPVAGGPSVVNLRLHFAELYWGARAAGGVGSRVFDIIVEGVTVKDNFDIFATAGGSRRALVVPIQGVAVNDGSLTITLKAEVDYAAISGIEVIRN
jgi:hypothetical protein